VVLRTVFVSLKPPWTNIEYELPPSDRIEAGGPFQSAARLEQSALMVTVCNGPREGGGFHIAPQARCDDGLFDICVADSVSRLRILGLIPHFMSGTHVDKPNVRMVRSAHVTITSQDPMIAHADGEVLCTKGHRIECEIYAGRLRVVGKALDAETAP
jgi:diacylglycerol kinase family enzyme